MKHRQTAYAISLSFGSPTLSLFRVQRFVGLLTFTFRRSYLILHQRTHLAFSPGHDSPSNDRLSPYADYPAQKRYFVITATKEACIFASMHLAAAPTCPGISPDSLVQQGTRMRVRRFMRLRVAHLPQKPFSYSIIHQNKNRLPFFGSLCILVISRHPGSIVARCPSANPRRCNKGFFSSVTLTLNVSYASEVKSFEP